MSADPTTVKQSVQDKDTKQEHDTLVGSDSTAIAAIASLSADALTILQPIVSHTTDTFKTAQSIVRDGIDLNRNHGWNLYGNAFYVAEQGYSIGEIEGNSTITFRVSKKIKILDNLKLGECNEKTLLSMAKEQGFDAIKDEGTTRKRNGKYSYNLAIIRTPQYLTPTGIYPVPSGDFVPTGISIPTIRTLQTLGIAGATYAVYSACKEIINSKQPLVETTHQTFLLGSAILGGKVAGAAAIVPCGLVGAAFPPLAPYTVPICIASASLLGGATAATITDKAWNFVPKPLQTDRKRSRDTSVTSRIPSERLYTAPWQYPDAHEYYLEEERHLPTLDRDDLARERCERKVKEERLRAERERKEYVEDETATERYSGFSLFGKANAAELPINTQRTTLPRKCNSNSESKQLSETNMATPKAQMQAENVNPAILTPEQRYLAGKGLIPEERPVYQDAMVRSSIIAALGQVLPDHPLNHLEKIDNDTSNPSIGHFLARDFYKEFFAELYKQGKHPNALGFKKIMDAPETVKTTNTKMMSMVNTVVNNTEFDNVDKKTIEKIAKLAEYSLQNETHPFVREQYAAWMRDHFQTISEKQQNKKNDAKKVDELLRISKENEAKLQELGEGLKSVEEEIKKRGEKESETDLYARRQQIREKIQQEQKSFSEKVKVVRGGANLGAQVLARFCSDGEPSDIRAAAQFSGAVDLAAEIVQNYSVIVANNQLVEAGFQQIDSSPQLLSIGISTVFLLLQMIHQDDNELNGFEALSEQMKRYFQQLLDRIAKFEEQMIRKLEEASYDRYEKHLLVLKEFAKARLDKADLEEKLRRIQTALLERQDKLEKSIEKNGLQVFSLQQWLQSDHECLRTEKVHSLVKRMESAFFRGEINSAESLHYWLDKLLDKATTVAKGKGVTGGNVDVQNSMQVITAFKGVPSLQGSIADHPAFSNINLIRNYIKGKFESELKTAAESFANPVIWAMCSKAMIKLFKELLDTNPHYPASQQHYQSDLKVMSEFYETGNNIIGFCQEIHKRKIIEKLIENYKKALEMVNKKVKDSIAKYEETWTKERQFALIQRVDNEVLDIEKMPKPVMKYFSEYLKKQIQARFVKANVPNKHIHVLAEKMHLLLLKQPYTDRGWKGVMKMKFNDQETKEIHEFGAVCRCMVGLSKEWPETFQKEASLEKTNDDNVLEISSKKDAIDKMKLRLFDESIVSSRLISQVLYPSKKEKSKINLCIPAIDIGDEETDSDVVTISSEEDRIDYILSIAEAYGVGKVSMLFTMSNNNLNVQFHFNFANKESPQLLGLYVKDLQLNSYPENYSPVSFDERLFDNWYGGRYAKPTDLISFRYQTHKLERYDAVSKIHYPPEKPYEPVRRDFLKTAENLFEKDEKLKAELDKLNQSIAIQVRSALKDERLKFKQTLNLNDELIKLDEAYYVLVETLKLVYGESALILDLIAAQDLVKNSDTILAYLRNFDGSDTFLNKRIDSTIGALPRLLASMQKLDPSIPVISKTLDNLKECTEGYRNKGIEQPAAKKPEETADVKVSAEHSQKSDLKSALKKVASLQTEHQQQEQLRNESLQRESKYAAEIAALKEEQTKITGMLSELLELSKAKSSGPPIITMYKSTTSEKANTSALSSSLSLLPDSGEKFSGSESSFSKTAIDIGTKSPLDKNKKKKVPGKGLSIVRQLKPKKARPFGRVTIEEVEE